MKASEDQIGGRHYKDYAIQPAEFIHKNSIGFLEGNVIKYVCRHSAKGGVKDLEKAAHYLRLLLEWQYGVVDETTPAAPPGAPPAGGLDRAVEWLDKVERANPMRTEKADPRKTTDATPFYGPSFPVGTVKPQNPGLEVSPLEVPHETR